ncbi:MAG: TatD family hydrolase [Oscillospiraceae bacterium]|nr:TatD family hydrolase [Oscillospiraceae bacterium]
MLFDTHAHYNDRRFTNAEEYITAARQGGVSRILNVGYDIPSSRASVKFTRQHDFMYASAGIHPHYVGKIRDEKATLAALAEILANPKAVALGECGLDYYRDLSPRDVQRYWFERQIELAISLDLPIIVHCREADGDCFDIVCRYPMARGVFHSFSGSAEMARQLTRRGWHLSFSGTLTYKNAEQVRAAFKATPTDKIMVETDCPYLSPHPMRGQTNHSGYLHYTAQMGADLLGMEFEEFARLSTENAVRLFGIGEE